jgi:hypothetical protein
MVYVLENFLRWLKIEGNATSYKTMKVFLTIDVAWFGNHETFVKLALYIIILPLSFNQNLYIQLMGHYP